MHLGTHLFPCQLHWFRDNAQVANENVARLLVVRTQSNFLVQDKIQVGLTLGLTRPGPRTPGELTAREFAEM